ncbi:MAG: murein biosynthesis integral membrane protein MurJ, partial [Chloroflexi bacterium]|nr:murein biosynthesis integral membrane protein MurJ [Chloroflexota bacterium]
AAQRPVAAAAALLMLGSVASRLLGLVREQVMAALFGATGGTDAFVAAYTVPTTVYDLLVGGAISAALVPVLVDVAERDERFWRLASALLTLAGLATAALAGALVPLAPLLLGLLVPGFASSRQDLAVLLVQLMLPALVLQGVSGVAMAALYARQRFALPAFGAAVFNLGLILAALALHALLGVTALVVGVLLGALLQAALQVAGLARLGLRFRPALDLRMPEVRTAIRLYGPVAAGMLVTIAGVIIDRNLASRLEEGSMSVMRYATTLVQFPLGLVGIATSLAVLPTLSRHAAAFTAGSRAGLDGYRQTLGFGVRLVLLLMVPATVGLIVLSEPVVGLLFERGAFTTYDTLRTSQVFLAYAPQIPFTALDQLLIVAFYARKDTRTPVLVGVGTVLLYLAAALLLLAPLGVVGLALANALQNSLHGLALFLLLQRAVGGLATSALAVHLLKLGLAAAAMGLAIALALPLGAGLAGPLARLAFLAALMGLGAALYLALLELLRVPEARVLRELALARVRDAGTRRRGDAETERGRS